VDARCGGGTSVTIALLESAGVQTRRVGLNHHVVAEAFYDGGWRVADALMFGGDQPTRDGRVLSVEELKADPYFADALPLRCFSYDPEVLTSEDGWQVLGYVFGPWGALPYYSYYLYAEKEHPPTLPTALPVQRVDDRRARLRWGESIKWGGGAVEYDVRVFEDRSCTREVFQAVTSECSIVLEVPRANWMYFVEVRAMDDHRRKNPDTWYPASRWNFVMAPGDQYGWYGMM